ncbi:AAA family ATPase [Aeromonas hydrophila]
MHISSIEISNLWGKEKIIIPFYEDVTLLTGVNGSGKSSLLNIIFDSLNCATKKRKPSTSKNRFWSSLLKFSNELEVTTLLIPACIDDKELEEAVANLLDDAKNMHDYLTLMKLKTLYDNHSNDFSKSYVSYTNNERGEHWRKQLEVPDNLDHEDLKDRFTRAPLGFLFQEDRKSLHNSENASVEFTGNYWSLYKSSIDERFSYCRDFMQVLESHLDKVVAKELRDANGDIERLFTSEEYKIATQRTQDIESIVDLLNSYFKDCKKHLIRDEQNKYTLASDESNEPIHWNLLSRGEKTIIYLLFATYYYKDRVMAFLLDEPEISLHVRWQKRLISDLRKVAPNNQFIIATHSPSLVKENWRSRCIEVAV